MRMQHTAYFKTKLIWTTIKIKKKIKRALFKCYRTKEVPILPVFYFYQPSEIEKSLQEYSTDCYWLLVSLHASLQLQQLILHLQQKLWQTKSTGLSFSFCCGCPASSTLRAFCSLGSCAALQWEHWQQNWSQGWKHTADVSSHLSSCSRTSHSAKLKCEKEKKERKGKKKRHVLSAFVTLGMHNECSRPNHYSSMRRRSWRQWLKKKEAPKVSLLGNCMAPRQHSAQLECNHHSDSEWDREKPSGLWGENKETPPALVGHRKDCSAPKTTAETGHWGVLLSAMLLAFTKTSAGKTILTAQRLREMQCGKPSLPPLQKAACCSQAQLSYALPCAASEMRHFCHHHPDAEKLSLPTNWQRISVLIIILPCTSAWSTSQKQD